MDVSQDIDLVTVEALLDSGSTATGGHGFVVKTALRTPDALPVAVKCPKTRGANGDRNVRSSVALFSFMLRCVASTA